jgi:hypothetical protein
MVLVQAQPAMPVMQRPPPMPAPMVQVSVRAPLPVPVQTPPLQQ